MNEGSQDTAGLALLCVSGDRTVRELLSDMVAQCYPELRLLVARDPRSGLEQCRQWQPELVITDLSRPNQDALRMAAAFRSLNPETSIIALTGRGDAAWLEAALETGFDQYLLKPFSPRKLRAAIDRCLALSTEHRKASAQDARIRLLSRVVAESPSSVIITDERGIITYVNDRFTRLTGYGRAEVIGRHPRFLKSDVMPEEAYDELKEVLATGREWRGQLLNRHKSGSCYWEEISVFPLHDPCGAVVSFVAVSEDITERKRSEAVMREINIELAARAAELEAANRELEAFSYTVAHDLHTPLQWIGGYSRAILKHSRDRLDERSRRYLEEISSGVVRMEEVIAALLNFSRLSRAPLQRQLVDLGEIARTVAADLMRGEPERPVVFRIADGVTVQGDRQLLFVVLQNLLGNAWKYTGSQRTAVIEFGVTEQGGVAACFVRDNGPGFDPCAAEQIFKPFHRLPGCDDSRGLGIGLATVQRIIQRHGGSVWAVAVPGGGATFYFTLDAGAGTITETEQSCGY